MYSIGLRSLFKEVFLGKNRIYQSTALFTFKTNMHVSIKISQYFSNVDKAQAGHKRQTENLAILFAFESEKETKIVGEADQLSIKISLYTKIKTLLSTLL